MRDRLGKKGISAIVATILMILITVSAVTILWTLIIPLITEGVEFDADETRLYIDGSSGYTFWDDTVNKLCVNVKRGQGDTNMTKVEVLFSIGGNTEKRYFNEGEAPLPGNSKTKCFSLDERPDSVSVAPVIVRGSQERSGIISSEVEIGDRLIGSSSGLLSDSECSESTYEVDCGDGEYCLSGSCGYNLTSCDTLDVEGGYYLLNNDIVVASGDCFVVEANNVTLDFAGFNITGDGSTGSGISIYGYNDTTIMDGEIYGFSEGISIVSSSSNNITSITANNNNREGIYFYRSLNNVLTSIISNSNNLGIQLASSPNNTLINIIASLNVRQGIFMDSSSNSTLTNIVANSNLIGGIYLSSSQNNILTNILTNSNQRGIYLSLSSDNTLTNISSCGNSDNDFYCPSILSNSVDKITYTSQTGCEDWLPIPTGSC